MAEKMLEELIEELIKNEKQNFTKILYEKFFQVSTIFNSNY